MNPLQAAKTLLKSPSMGLIALNKRYNSWSIGDENPTGINIFEEDWDNLVILDACRFDALQKMIDLEGSLESKTSKGTSTPQFLRTNFTRERLHDTVYVTANGWIIRLWDELNTELHQINCLVDNDDLGEKGGGISPKRVTDEALETAERYPNKRLVIHYVQPHKPYLGDFGRRKFGHAQKNLQAIMSNRGISDDDLWRAYNENLELVLEYVSELVSELNGRTVITSDHGELLGERTSPIPVKSYGHPTKLYHDSLTRVPWFVCESNSRKDITGSPPEEMAEVDEEELNERLKDLGYAV
ncbi:sulfatase-like hydrolase/transferase [Haloferax sp. Atlit-12N]|uniref:sulfatase-like hydrolase/transferase n=1 Tax=Haloferax sp. Atlit-12N TaxID=2077203 RepID=UPI000E2496B6|nr:sulfatase-like hydrolase/transferase [Haloferax sp. Atlit-12N]